ncbi:MAG: 3-dehydroquinate synthase [Phycisphaerales bacterium]
MAPRSPRPGQRATESVDASFAIDCTHRLRFTREVFNPSNPTLADLAGLDPSSPRRIVAFVDDGLLSGWPDLEAQINAYASDHGDELRLVGGPHTVTGGERAKNDEEILNTVLQAIHDAKICRRSYVLAVGGGAVLDVVGYAAAIAHRGVRLIRCPTTTLSQADSGVGVKNGVNRFGKKNYLGVFAVPWAVVNDAAFLRTLSDADWRCGIAEAIKVGLVKDAALFDKIEANAAALARREEDASEPIWKESAEAHLRHIAQGGDPFELTQARPLDFGHWAAHKLEAISNFEVRHGEAVAIGMALDSIYSFLTGRLSERDAGRIIDLLESVGFRLWREEMANRALFEGIDEFREHLGGRLTVAMLDAIGRPVDVHEIDESKMSEALRRLRERASRH